MILSLFSRPASVKQAAFTFVELLIAVAIMIITLSIGVINYLQFLDKQNLYQSGSAVEEILKDARSKAQGGFLGNEELGFCAQLAAVEVFSSLTADSQVTFTAQLRCANGDLLTYDSYLVNQTDATINPSLKISFLPMRGANVLLNNIPVASGSSNLSRNNSDVVFSFDQGGTVNVSYQ